ncbi:MAG: hypothetical protein JRE10_12540 [Deltaproteobacteria bacterium]|jgi:hypothetical protein|nr:hypothetical protein [Deltaproteobacteria bacterium]
MDKKTGDFPWLKLGVFAKTGDIEKAINAGVNESGRPCSGEFYFSIFFKFPSFFLCRSNWSVLNIKYT